MTNHDQVIGGRSYCSARDPRVHFGLESLARADTLEIRWLGGKRQLFTDLPIDRYVAVWEGPESTP